MSNRRKWLLRGLAAAAIAVAFAHNAAATWDTWGDLIIDTGRELDTPKQLAAGKMLYRDVRYWYGPLAPYTNALLYKMFGVHVRTLTGAGLASAALLAWIAYRTLRLFTGRAAAAAATAAILYMCAFLQYYWLNIFNFVLPYAYPATYGMLAAAASLYFLLRHVRSGRKLLFFISAALLAVTALCKLEVLFVGVAVHGVFVAVTVFGRLQPRAPGAPTEGLAREAPWRVLLAGYLGGLLVTAAVYSWFYAHAGPQLVTENLFLAGNLGANLFTLEHSGLANLSTSLGELARSAAGLGIALAAIAVSSVIAKRYTSAAQPTMLVSQGSRQVRPGPAARTRKTPSYEAATSSGVAWGLAIVAAAVSASVPVWTDALILFRAVPFLLAGAAGWHAWRVFKGHRQQRRELALLLLYVAGLSGVSRIPLRAGAEHYGFYLFVPALLGLVALWAGELPRLFGAGRARLPAYLSCIALLVSAAWMHHVRTEASAATAFGRPALKVSTAHGTLPCQKIYAGSVDEAVKFLTTQPAGQTVVALPEGATIGFLAGDVNPLGLHTFLPLDLAGAYADARVIELLTAARPDYIVVSTRDVREYGKTELGVDYGQQLMSWVAGNYADAARYETARYAVLIMRRK